MHAVSNHQSGIRTDSTYVRDGSTRWRAGWQAKGMRTKTGPVKNVDLWPALWTALDARPLVRIEWVRGHAGERGNEIVDRLAEAAAERRAAGGPAEDGVLQVEALIERVVIAKSEAALGRRKPKNLHVGGEQVGKFYTIVQLPHRIRGEKHLALYEEGPALGMFGLGGPSLDETRVSDEVSLPRRTFMDHSPAPSDAARLNSSSAATQGGRRRRAHGATHDKRTVDKCLILFAYEPPKSGGWGTRIRT
ncbi:RNase H family protein [Bosea sp. Root381]|uniref:RNase H family protein n=1 Tax=Bosea sp. Root381 TaxID=1736524 RepID=UPI0009EA72B4|nr:RNase H family protein [Bosea sp. Root381]